MTRILRIISVVLGMLLCLTANAEVSLRMRQLSVNNGLSYYDVNDLVQDGYGFMWIATNDGLNRYDGVSVKSFRNDPDDPNSISYNRVKSLEFFPTMNQVWAGTDGGGINIYDYQKEQFRRVYLTDDHRTWNPENDIVDLAACGDSMAVVATRTDIKLVKYLDESDVMMLLQTLSFPSKTLIKNVFFESNILYIVYNTEIHRYRLGDSGLEFLSEIEIPQPARVNTVRVSNDGRLFVTTKRGIFIAENAISSNAVKVLKFPISSPINEKDNFNSIVFDGDEIIVVVEGKGLFSINENGKALSVERINTNAEDFWQGNRIRTLHVDRTKTLWVTSMSKGLGIIDLLQKQFNSISIASTTENLSPISRMVFDPDGDLWLGTQRSGAFIRTTSGKVQGLQIPAGPVTSISLDGNAYQICVGGKLVRGRKNARTQPVRVYPDDSGKIPDLGAIYSSTKDRYGNSWMGCRRGIIRISGDDIQQYPFNVQSSVKIVEDTVNNVIWAASARGGLLQIEMQENGIVAGQYEYHNTPGNTYTISSEVVWALLPSSNGDVYVGTDVGMNIVDPVNRIVRRMPSTSLLSDHKVLAITEDNRGNLWVNTSQGLICYSIGNGRETLFNSSDGLLSDSMTEAALLVGDKMYVGCNEGINFFSINDILGSYAPADVLINSVKVSGQQVVAVPSEQSMTLNYSNNSVSFGVSVLSYNNPRKNGYAYRLRGLEDKWSVVAAAQNTVSYSNLSSGRYVFELAPLGENGLPMNAVQSMKIRIKPAPWNSIWAWCLYIIVVASLLGLYINVKAHRRKVDQQLLVEKIRNQAEHDANENKLRFYANVTHELRTPLTLVTAPLQEVSERKDLPEDVREKLALMRRNGDRLMELVNHFLELRKMDNQTLPLVVGRCDIISLCRDIYSRFSFAAQQKNIHYRFSAEQDSLKGWVDSDKLTTIISNLLSNAFKYTPQGGEITLSLSFKDNKLTCSVMDTGCGISDQDIEHIFERFYQCEHNAVAGTGIGLELVSRMVQLHKGKIEVESKTGLGSTFSFTIPIDRESYPSENRISQSEMAAQRSSLMMDESSTKEPAKESILVVEDDEDMRSFIVSILEKDYNVIQARNGEEGREIAVQILPDIILSDVMMPIMDGIEMCSQLKEDFRTNHIPVVMLTAKDDELEGLRSGAVDYIMKPFSPEKLCLKLKNQLASRRAMRVDTSNPSESIKTRIDQYKDESQKAFLEKLIAIINEHIDDTAFDVDQLTMILGVSRTQLHRKMTSLTGKGISSFIRNVRLDKAKEMIESGRYSVTEVLYSVGFSSPSYFSKMFKERFGYLPSDITK